MSWMLIMRIINSLPYFISDDSFFARLDLWTAWIEDMFPGSGMAFLEELEDADDDQYSKDMDQADYELLVEGCIDNIHDEDLPGAD